MATSVSLRLFWNVKRARGAQSSPEGHPRIVPFYITLKALLLCPPHAIVMRSHGRDGYVVILIPETVDLLGL